jgi:hypothetical protein
MISGVRDSTLRLPGLTSGENKGYPLHESTEEVACLERKSQRKDQGTLESNRQNAIQGNPVNYPGILYQGEN